MRRPTRDPAALNPPLAALLLLLSAPGCKAKRVPDAEARLPPATPYANPRAKTAGTGPLRVVAERFGELHLGVMGDGRVYLAGGVWFGIARDEGDFAHEPAWLTGLRGEDVALGGRFPEDAWATVSTKWDAGRAARLLHYEAGSWRSKANRAYQPLTPWKDGKTLSLARPRWLEEKGKLPKLESLGSPDDRSVPGLREGAYPHALASFASGEVLVAYAAAVHRFGSTGGEGALDPLPASDGLLRIDALVAPRIDDAWVTGTYRNGAPYFAHWNGAEWRPAEPPPTEGAIHDLTPPAAPADLVTLFSVPAAEASALVTELGKIKAPNPEHGSWPIELTVHGERRAGIWSLICVEECRARLTALAKRLPNGKLTWVRQPRDAAKLPAKFAP